MHTNVCGFVISCSSLMYFAPPGFFSLEHLASSCRSAFRPLLLILKKVHPRFRLVVRDGHPPLSRGHLAQPSQVLLEVFPWHRLLPCVAPATVWCYPCTASRADSDVLSTRTDHWSSSSATASVVLSQPENLLFFQQDPLQMRTRTCESALWRRVWCTARYRHRISSVKCTGNSQVVHAEVQRNT